jgi:hypothetical protein
MVTVRKGRLRNEAALPVSYPDSQSFRWLVIAHLYLLVLVATVLTVLFGDKLWIDPLQFENGAGWLGLLGSAAIIHIGIVGYLAAITGLPSYFFHPRQLSVEQQNRAVALSYYACAPLAWLLLAAVILTGGTLIREQFADHLAGWIALIVGGLIAFCSIIAWPIALRFFGRTALGGVRPERISILLPLLWLGVTGAIVVVYPLIVLFIGVLIASLR